LIIFFVHEPPESLLFINELIEEAGKLKQEGKIRAIGLAYMRTDYPLHASYINQFDILQFDNSPGAPDYGSVLDARGSKPNIIFSPLKGNVDMRPNDKLKCLFKDFSNSVILCSMFSEKHIKENAEVFSSHNYSQLAL